MKWIKCSDRLPCFCEENYIEDVSKELKFLVLCDDGIVYCGFLQYEPNQNFRDKLKWVIFPGYTCSLEEVTHWCEIEYPEE